MFKVKAWIFTPQVIICYIFMAVILIAVLSGYTEVPKVTNPTPVKVVDYGTQPLTYKDMKKYQVVVSGRHAIFYDYDAIAFVVDLDVDCNLTRAIQRDSK